MSTQEKISTADFEQMSKDEKSEFLDRAGIGGLSNHEIGTPNFGLFNVKSLGDGFGVGVWTGEELEVFAYDTASSLEDAWRIGKNLLFEKTR